MGKNLTAVEWLIEKIAEDYTEIPRAYKEECQKAKQMEKEQIIGAHNDGALMAYALPFNAPFKKGEEYYNEIYGK